MPVVSEGCVTTEDVLLVVEDSTVGLRAGFVLEVEFVVVAAAVVVPDAVELLVVKKVEG